MKSPVRTKRKQRPKGKSAAGRRKVVKATKAKPTRAGRTPDPLDAFIVGAAHALDLKIEPACMPAVRANLHVILTQAALVDEFALPDEAEPAPAFKA
jgi:Protein of unknown function (DUF4089)